MMVQSDRPRASGALLVEPVPDDLATHFEYLWHLVVQPGDAPDASWRIVADGYVDLAIRVPLTADVLDAVSRGLALTQAAAIVRDAVWSAAPVVCGAAQTSRLMPVPVPLLVTGLRFRHGAAVGALRTAPADVVNGSAALSAILGGAPATQVSSPMAGAARAPIRARLVEHAAEPLLRAEARARIESVARRLVTRGGRRPPPIDPRLQRAMQLLERRSPSGDPSEDHLVLRVAGAARALGTSLRTLERVFSEQLGFTARTFQRIGRVGIVAQWLERDASLVQAGVRASAAKTLSMLAQDAGYADHAHMTREFVGAMGVPPSLFRREVMESMVQRHIGAVQLERGAPIGTMVRGQPL